MSTDPAAGDRDRASFLVEVSELLQIIEQDLLSLKENRSLNKIHNLMRMTHTLKGAAASVGLETLKQVAHCLEDVFKTLYNPNLIIDSKLEELLFQSYECLRLPICAQLAHTSLNESEVLNRAASVFTQLQEKLGDFSTRQVQLPTAADLGVDLTQSIFETEVRERLAALAAALVQPQTGQVEMMLRSSSTVFVGLSEALNLPGFGAIAQGAIAALDAHPDRSVTIAQIALQDFQSSTDLVLAGDRNYVGEPSPELRQLAGLEEDKGTREGDNQTTATSPIPLFLSPPAVDSPLVAAPTQTIRVELEEWEYLNHLIGNLLTYQTQQGAANQQIQAIVQKLQEQIQQHQQTLNRIHELADGGLIRFEQRAATGGESPDELFFLLQSASKETLLLAFATANAALLSQESSQTWEKQQQLLADVRGSLRDVRMSSLGDVFNRLDRVLQQLVAVYGKPAQLQLSGSDVLVDKTIAQKLYDPLLHLIRNAFDHGIESPQVRRQLGKPETGQIRLHAYQQQKQTVIEVSDDGRGLDFEKIIQRAVQMNLLSLEQVLTLCEQKIFSLLFEPGFSTAAEANDLSGRGLGLDVVRSQLQLMHGSISVKSQAQKGTTFTLQIPSTSIMAELEVVETQNFVPRQIEEILDQAPKPVQGDVNVAALNESMAIEPANGAIAQQRLDTERFFVWLAGSIVFTLPYRNIEEYLGSKVDRSVQQQQQFLLWRDMMIPLYKLSELLKYNYPLPEANYHQAEDTAIVLAIALGNQNVAIESAVDRLLTTELAIEPFGVAIAAPNYIYGCTVLEHNRLVLVIDTIALLQHHIQSG